MVKHPCVLRGTGGKREAFNLLLNPNYGENFTVNISIKT
jgi:hypothetical protein